MTSTIEQLARFSRQNTYDALPCEVVAEIKRILLDSIGCALAAQDSQIGRIGIEYGNLLGGAEAAASIIGRKQKCSVFGAAFANAELINALDYDCVLPPGHVTPYVLPSALAIAESSGSTGQELICALAIAHEMSFRLGKAMDYLRDVKDGKVRPPPVYGYASSIFGGTAAIARLKGFSLEQAASALGIAASITPVNSQASWFRHLPLSTIKYLSAGGMALSALHAAYLAELGHRGDIAALDDKEFGYARFIGTSRWDVDAITDGIGDEWRFPRHQTFKPYPHCRIFHALIQSLLEIIEEQSIEPDEIQCIKAWVEGFVEQPVWLNREITSPVDAQFSLAHGLAVAAHRIPIGKKWQDPEIVFNPSVLALMNKVQHQIHPNYVELLSSNAGSQPARIEVMARGQTFVRERLFPKGTKSADPDSEMTTEELVAKFKNNAEASLSRECSEQMIEQIMNLEKNADITSFCDKLRAGVLA